MKKIILLIIPFFAFCISGMAQQNTYVSNNKSENRDNSSSEESITEKSNKEIKGDKYFFIYAFDKAIGMYIRENELSINGQRNLAESYKNMGQNEKAEQMYSEIISQPGAFSEDYYNYAALLKNSGKYNEAFSMMDKFYEMNPMDLRARDYMANKNKFANLLRDDGTFRIKQLEINSNADDFAPSFYGNKIVFASTKRAPRMIVRRYNWTNKPFWNMYIADVETGQLEKAKYFKKSRNSKFHDGPASFSNDGTFMAFTRNKINDKSDDNMVEFLIWFSSFVDGEWSEPVPFALNSTEYQVGHPSLSPDGNTMYFASDMPGGFGGSDIYRVTRTEGGTWGAAENMGSTVNTEGDEMFPFIESTNQVLFFSSNGRFGLGGLDIFYCSVNGSVAGKAKNAGYPLNTQYDDFAFIIDNTLSRGYFSSNRTGGSGGDDIYGFDLLKNLDIEKRIEGIAQDINGNPLSETYVMLIDAQGYMVDSTTTENEGTFVFFAEADENYKLIGIKEEYLNGQNTTNTFGRETVIIADITLLMEKTTVVIPEVIADVVREKIGNLNPIYFDLDRYNIRPDAQIELNKIVRIMNDNPTMVVELSSHTDSRASHEYNMVLSDKRAKATLNYIKSRIVNPERIYGRGYGENVLVNNCIDEGDIVSTCTEEQHQANRRTEFVIEK